MKGTKGGGRGRHTGIVILLMELGLCVVCFYDVGGCEEIQSDK